MLKFEGKFKYGEVIKGYHFPPTKEHGESYIKGTVIETDNFENGFAAYKVVQLENVIGGKPMKDEVGTFAWIPHQVSMLEFDNRVTKVEATT